MREVALDTETTGLDAQGGDRVIEIGAVELVNHVATGRVFHVHLNPERAVHPDAVAIHGLTDAFLADKPLFAQVADAFEAFVGEAPLVIHNARFDMGFLNAERARLGREAWPMSRSVDTVAMARRKHPGAPASLDALCKRYGVDNAGRTLHGALLDAQLLAEVYLALMGGRQRAFGLTAAGEGKAGATGWTPPPRPRPLATRITAEERAAHEAFVATLGEGALWRKLGG